MRISSHPHSHVHVCDLIVCSLYSHLVPFRVFLLLLLPEPGPVPLLLPCGPHRQYPTGTPPNEESGPLAGKAPLTGYEPNTLDDFHYSGTTEIFLREQSSDGVPSYLHDAELSDETIARALSSPLFIQERQEPADRRQAYHSFEESLLPSVFVCLSCKNLETRA